MSPSTHVLALVGCLLAASSVVQAGPCDIYAAGNTSCVAAHSTTRALYDEYNGPLYQVQRQDNDDVADIYPLSAGGVANAASQDKFCSGSQAQCLVTIIYDQSGHGNDLTQAPGNEASATGAPVTLGGHKVYGLYVAPGTGYRIAHTHGVAKGNQPEGMYAVLDGTHYNDQCCFDYGNAEVNITDAGPTTIEAINFGTTQSTGDRTGHGPWIGADFEDGIFLSLDKSTPSPSVPYRFLQAVLKGGHNLYALRGGPADSGSLTTYYSGPRPNGYHRMHKQGAIILGVGGDDSDGSNGTFYEGVMTFGYPSDNTEDLVHSNIVSEKYAVHGM